MDLLDRLLGHDEWTTGEFLRRCGELTDDQLHADFDVGLGSIHRTLVHVIGNIRVWTDLMQAGTTDGATSEWRDRDLTGLAEAFRSSYADFTDFARRMRDTGRLEEFWVDALDDPPQSKTYGGAILHVISHNMHHRGELLHMLDRLGLSDLPEGDMLSWEAMAVAERGAVTT
jgi:uncharacterized damage-inducible protein DinB